MVPARQIAAGRCGQRHQSLQGGPLFRSDQFDPSDHHARDLRLSGDLQGQMAIRPFTRHQIKQPESAALKIRLLPGIQHGVGFLRIQSFGDQLPTHFRTKPGKIFPGMSGGPGGHPRTRRNESHFTIAAKIRQPAHAGRAGHRQFLPIPHHPHWGLQTSHAAIKQIPFGFPRGSRHGHRVNRPWRPPDVRIGGRSIRPPSHPQASPDHRAGGMPVNPAPFQPRSHHLGVRIKFTDPARRKSHLDVHHRFFFVRGMEINHRRLEPHDNIRMAVRKRDLGGNCRHTGRSDQSASNPVHKIRHGLVIDVDAGNSLTVLVLQHREGPPFVHNERCAPEQAGAQKNEESGQTDHAVIPAKFAGSVVRKL